MPEQSIDQNRFLLYDAEIPAAGSGKVSVQKQTRIQDPYIVPIVRFAFYGFVATIPFETVDLGIPILEPTVISLGFLLMCLIFQIPLIFQKPPVAYWLFFLYLLIFIFPVVTGAVDNLEEARWQMIVMIQLVVMSWVAFNLMRSEKVARMALLTLALSCSLLALLQFTGFSGANAGDRTTALGFHPNNIARILALGMLALFGLTYGGKKSINLPVYLVWFLFAVIGLAIIQTSSRGALLALVAGIIVFMLRKGNFAVKIRNSFLVFAGIGFLAVFAYQSEVTRERFIEAIEDGDLARREMIFPTAWEMFLEKPLLGWGAKDNEYELGTRLGHIEESSKNPHNLILYVLISSGIIGAVPLFIGIGLAVLKAWKARDGLRGILPLSLISMVLIANMSGLWLHNKMHWLVMAYALSSPAAIGLQKRAANFKNSPAEYAG